jgi:2,4-dienoyl-CoA reductase-like NADH-dependent reductase (Old Yellow Enzyme family)
MRRDGYTIFSEGTIRDIRLNNRLVRSATGDGLEVTERVTDQMVDVYRRLAEGGVGLIISGEIPIAARIGAGAYHDVWIEGIHRIAEVAHESPGCKIVAQIGGSLGVLASEFPTPFVHRRELPASRADIRRIEECFVNVLSRLRDVGFDGVQLNAAHGYFLCSFLSSYMNRRDDEYGGSVQNRARIVREIVSQARVKVGDFPIFIKMNCTDHMPESDDVRAFHEMAGEIERTGVDSIEASGGIVECLTRTEEELGFRPVRSADAHTHIRNPDKQSYFSRFIEGVDLDIPLILVGGNRDIELLERIVRTGNADFVSLCRPLIREPELPNRWLEDRGGSTAECISCNSCTYHPAVKPGEYAGPVCFCDRDRELHREAQNWLSDWVERYASLE